MTELDLEDNCIGPEGAVYLAEALQDNNYVTRLVRAAVVRLMIAKTETKTITNIVEFEYCISI